MTTDILGSVTYLETPTVNGVAVQLANAATVFPAGTTTVPPIDLTPGVLLTTPLVGGIEFNGVNLYGTIDTSSGRGMVPIIHYNHLTAVGTNITTIANFFGAVSNPPLVANAYYEIEIVVYFLKTTASTIVWTLTNSAAPISQNINFEMSPITGIVAPPGTATILSGVSYNNTAAVYTVTTGSLSSAVNHFAKFRIFMQNGTGTSLKIQATSTSGSITPGINSYWFSKRLSPSSVGTFAA